MSSRPEVDVCPKGRPTDLYHRHMCWVCGTTVSCDSAGKVWVALEDARVVMLCLDCFDPGEKPPESPGPDYIAALKTKRRPIKPSLFRPKATYLQPLGADIGVHKLRMEGSSP